jgi:hypothetical protein
MRRRFAAFTLAEVMAVAVIVAVLASLGLASLSSVVQRARAAQGADAVEGLVRQARNVARAQRRCVRVDVFEDRIALVPLLHRRSPPADCLGGDDDTAGTATRAMPASVRLVRTSFFFDRQGGAVAGEHTVTGTVVVPDMPPSTFTVRALPGAGSIVRRG